MPEPQIALKVASLGPDLLSDPFSRTVTGSWGTAPTGQTWQHQGSAASFQVDGVAQHIHQTVNSGRISLVDAGSRDVRMAGNFKVNATPTGGPFTACLLGRYLDANTYYQARIGWIINTGEITCSLRLRYLGVDDTIASVVVPGLIHVPGTWYRMACEFVDSRLAAKLWRVGDPPPALWQVTAQDDRITAGTQAGIRSILDAASTNALPVTYYFDEVSISPYWTDLAGRLHYGDGGGPLTVDIGRQTELQDVEPTRIAATLKNGDGWLNPRNPASPYYATWEQGRQVRVTETVGGQEIDLATGYLEIPDVQVNSPNLDQPCSITAVDLLGRLAGAAPFDGTLAEHIRSFGGNLVEWYPLSDAADGGQYLSVATGAVTTRSIQGFAGQTPIAAEPEELIKPQDADGPSGDDQRYARWAPVGDAAGLSTFADAYLTAPISVTAGLADTIALSAWVLPEDYNMAAGSVEPGGFTVRIQRQTPTTLLTIGKDFAGGSTWYNGGSVYHSGLGAVANLNAGRPYERHTWRLVTVRLTLSSGLLELYSGADVAVSTTVAAPAVPLTFDELLMGFAWAGGIAHVQVRVGPAASTMTRQMHLDQYAHGYCGLHRQTVAERIATLAGYAGLSSADLALPADASTPMQAARLAGTNPAAAMQDAATTGQDTLMTNPPGQLTLVSRSRRYSQPIAMSIPFGWLSRGGIRYRPDKPVTDTLASRTSGGSARRVDSALRARYGVNSRTVTLNTAVDADLANWASWTLDAMSEPRTRCPLIRLNMLKRTTAERQQLLALRVGDRIQLTGMPANSPEDVPHLIVQGIRHIIGPDRRRLIEFNTSPLLGPSPGVPPACPVVGDLVANTAIVAY